MPSNFSFILPNQLAGCALPGQYDDLRSDLASLAEQGIGAVVSLTEEPLAPEALAALGLRYLHLPIVDFRSPDQKQIDVFVAFVAACLAEKVAVAVHCAAGMGRTGVMLACFLVSRGMKPDAALRKVRRERPGSVETPGQEQCIRDFARRRSEGGGRK